MSESMSEVSPTPLERARKAVSIVLRALQEPGRQVAIATAMGCSESTVSRLKNDQLEQFCLLLAHAGLKIVDVSRVCVDRASYEAMTHIASRAMANRDFAQQLIWEND